MLAGIKGLEVVFSWHMPRLSYFDWMNAPSMAEIVNKPKHHINLIKIDEIWLHGGYMEIICWFCLMWFCGKYLINMVGLHRLELWTNGLWVRCSNQLSYRPIFLKLYEYNNIEFETAACKTTLNDFKWLRNPSKRNSLITSAHHTLCRYEE